MPLRFASPVWLIPCLILVVLMVAAGAVRRPALPGWSKILAVLGALLLALAAGQPQAKLPAATPVTVMVDVSPSTRGAGYRDRANLEARIHQLLGDIPRRVIFFGAENKADGGGPLVEMPCDRTVFAPPACAAVLLFSDGQFAVPVAGPPTYVAVDGALDRVADAAVTRLEARDGAATAEVVNHTGESRTLVFDGATGGAASAPPGAIILTRALDPGATSVSVQLAGGDQWPENDKLTISVLPPAFTQRWWITSHVAAPDGTWTVISPSDRRLQDPSAYLSASVAALANVAAGDLPPAAQDRLTQYVRDLGGALLVLGGDRAFSAGGYAGTQLETLSPLASSPPAPQRQWLVLADSSGSMGADAGGGATRWSMACAAMARLIGRLPPADPVSVGSFAQDVRWWSQGQSAGRTAATTLPPGDIQPSGPTNLEPALDAIAAQGQGAKPCEVVVISDAQTTIDHPGELAAALLAHQMRLDLLVIGASDPPAALLEVVQGTRGSWVKESAAAKWEAAAQNLLGKIAPGQWIVGPAAVAVEFTDEPRLADCRAAGWDQTWLKPTATQIAHAGGVDVPMAARWQVGAGQVLATAFAPRGDESAALAQGIAHAPRDPRWRVHWEVGPELRVRIDAMDAGAYLNGENFSMELSRAAQVTAVPQTGPGRYELALPAPGQSVIATLRHGEQTIDRAAIPGRYAREFDALGNNYEVFGELVARTGGQLIDTRQTTPVDFHWPGRAVALSAIVGCAGAALLAAALAVWRIA